MAKAAKRKADAHREDLEGGRAAAEMEIAEKTIDGNTLIGFYDQFSEKYECEYPEVRNPNALISGLDSIMERIHRGEIKDNTLIYILEDELDAEDPQRCRYVLMVTKSTDMSMIDEATQFSIKLFYNETQELESISTFESSQVTWSPDNIANTLHPLRTKYYMGFTYMVCEQSPGFDEEVRPEAEVSIQELIELGAEGEIPAELIEVTIETEGEAETPEAQQEEQHEADVESEGEELFDVPITADEFIDDDDEAPETEREDERSVMEREIDALFDEDDMFEIASQVDEDDAGDNDGDEVAESEQKEGAETDEELFEEEDDTEVTILSPEEYEDEYDDLETDYEELFEE